MVDAITVAIISHNNATWIAELDKEANSSESAGAKLTERLSGNVRKGGSGEVEGGGGSGPLPGFRASFLARPAGPLTSASLRLPGYRPQQAASQTKATFYHLIAN